MQLRARIRERPCRRSRLYLLLRTHTAVRRPPGNPAAETTRPCICAHCECDVILNYVPYVINVVFSPSKHDMSSKFISKSGHRRYGEREKQSGYHSDTSSHISCVTFLTFDRDPHLKPRYRPVRYAQYTTLVQAQDPCRARSRSRLFHRNRGTDPRGNADGTRHPTGAAVGKMMAGRAPAEAPPTHRPSGLSQHSSVRVHGSAPTIAAAALSASGACAAQAAKPPQ